MIQKHKISAEQTYIDYMLNGIEPKCKCGCGGLTNFLSIEKGLLITFSSHAARVNNNWGHNKEALAKSHITQKAMHETGTLNILNKGLTMADARVKDNIEKVMSNPERGNNISKKLSGVSKSEVHIQNIKKSADIRWSDPMEREKQSQRLISRLIKNNYRNKKTKIEASLEEILKGLKLVYKYQHQVSNAIFDFLLINKNTLIEVDGDFHHCNPNTIHKIPIYPIQKIKTVGNDIRKNRIAEVNNYKLIRFWEEDNERPEWIVEQLKSEIL